MFSVILSAILAGIAVFVLVKIRSHFGNRTKKDKPRQYVHPIFPDMDAEDFSEKMLDILRSYSEYRYAPKRSRSHTNRDILSYVTDPAIVSLWQELEEDVYRGVGESRMDRGGIVLQIKNIL